MTNQNEFNRRLALLKTEANLFKEEVTDAGKTTEATMREDILTVQRACMGNQILHLSRCFTKSPGHAAVVVCYVTCDDEIATELHKRLDATAREFFAEHGITIIPPSQV